MICKYCETEHPEDQIANPHYCIAMMETQLSKRDDEIAALTESDRSKEVALMSIAGLLGINQNEWAGIENVLSERLLSLTAERDTLAIALSQAGDRNNVLTAENARLKHELRAYDSIERRENEEDKGL